MRNFQGLINICHRYKAVVNNQSAIKKGVVLSYLVIIFNIVAGLIYTPWMISKIGKADYGLYILVTSFLAYFTVDYGLWQSVNKLVAENHVKGNYLQEYKVLNVATSIYLIIDICIAIVLALVFICIDRIYTNLSNSELTLFKTLFIIASGFALLSFPFLFLKGVFMGREFFVASKVFDLLKRCGVIIITIILLWFDYGVISLVIAFGSVPLLLYFAEYGYLWRKGYRIHPVRIDKYTAKAILGLSMWLFIIVLGELFISNISPSILAKYADTTQIAVFAIGLSLYGYVYAFARAINGFFLPKVIRGRFVGDTDMMQNLSRQVSSIQLAVVGVFILGIVILGKQFIDLWVGVSFIDSYYVACLLLIPGIVNFCQPIENTELFASDNLKYSGWMNITTAISSVILGIILCPRLGAIGVALAICLSKIVFMVIGMNICFYKVLKRSPLPFFKLLLRYLAVFTLIIGLNYLIDGMLPETSSWMGFIIQGIVYVIIYIPLAYYLAIPIAVRSKYIKEPMKRLIKKH